MSDLLSGAYLWVKALHVMAVIGWMAGLFYLPRLFVYHVEGVQAGTPTDVMFQKMERLLLKATRPRRCSSPGRRSRETSSKKVPPATASRWHALPVRSRAC